ncbi:MAG: cation transporter dimerization domain-containing protein [Candidatus Bathyarchaeia archaeon]|jgi:divalent metal cation (Fe/Co/Zn/Cd) transporter
MPIPLLERSSKEISRTIKSSIEELPEVKGVRHVSVRMTGKRLDITAHILLDNTLRFEDIHRIVSSVEHQVRSKVQRIARITVQTEPVGHARIGLASLVSEIAENVPGSRGVHNVYIQKINGKVCVDLRLEVSANIAVKQAHEISKEVERRLKAANAHVSEVTIHLESASDLVSRELEGHGTELRWYIEHAAKKFPEIKAIHGVKIRRSGNTLRAVLRCRFDPTMSVKQAHDTSLKLEKTVKSAYPVLDDLEVVQESA